MIRFANEFLEAYKTNKNFILYRDLCDYARIDGDTERYIFSQYGLESLIGDPSKYLRTSKSHGYTLFRITPRIRAVG